jgi:hypothetical protein
MLRSFCLILLICGIARTASAQQFAISRLFYPNITLRTDVLPSQSLKGTDGSSFGLSRTSIQGIIPLRSEIQAGIGIGRKFDVQVKHTVLFTNFSQLKPELNDIRTPSGGYKTASAAIIMMRASLRDRLWVYGAGGGITESNETFFTPQPYLFGGVARLRVFGLQSQVIYGTTVIYSQKFRIIPIVGINKRFNKDWRVSAVLPFNANLNYRATPWFNVDATAAYGGYSAGFKEVSATETLLRRNNYQQVKFSLSANAHLFTVLGLSVEAGLAGFRQIRTFNSALENLATVRPATGPYFGASVRYITSRGKATSKFTNKLFGVKGGDFNW